MKYRFSHWENGETSSTRTLTLTHNGQTINAGESIDLLEGAQVTMMVPNEVSG